jgi:hypothetical protein
MKIAKKRIGEGPPPQGLSEARRGKEVFFQLLIRRGGAPSGAAAFITTGGLGGLYSHHPISSGLVMPDDYSYPPVFPFVNILTVMVERQPVFIAIIPVTIFTEKREIYPLPAGSTGLVQGILLFPEESCKKAGNGVSKSHGGLFAAQA